MIRKNSYNENNVRELQLYVENDRNIYEQRLEPVYKNLFKKQEKRVYDSEKATKLYKNAVDDASKKYIKKFGSNNSNIFTIEDRKEVARRLEKENRNNLKNLV